METVRHIVCFSFTAEATTVEIRHVTDMLADLTKKIPGIESFEHGEDNSPEGKNLGFTHIYQFTFENAAARDSYLTHPAHVQFNDYLRALGILGNVAVLDYEIALVVDNSRQRGGG